MPQPVCRALCLILLGLFAIAVSPALEKDISPGLAIFYNLLPGFGVGSFRQHDDFAGFILITTETTAYLMIFAGFISMASAPTSSTAGDFRDGFLLTAFFMYGGAKILGIVFPLLRHAFTGSAAPAGQDARESPGPVFQPRVTLADSGRPALDLCLSISLP
jgi:hypothetical protein